jgi:O-antigen ligase
MLGCLRAALALAILAFLPGLRESFEPPKAAAVRVCGLALLAAALAAPRIRRQAERLPLDLAVGAWLLVEILSTAFSASPLLSLVGEPVQREGLLTSLALAGAYLAMRTLPSHARGAGLDATLGWILVPAAVAAAYALAQGAGIDPFGWAPSAIYPGGSGGMRPFGTLGHPNLLGVVTACAASAALARAVGEGRGRAWFGAAAILLAAATLATLSRGAWLALGVGGAAGLALAARAQSGATARRAWALAALCLVTLFVVALAAGWGPRLAARAQDLLTPLAGSGPSRLEIWRTAWAAFLARPLLGHGPDTFELVFPRFQTPAYWRFEWAGLAVHAHSVVLHTLATRGLAGAAAGAALLVTVVMAARAAWRRSPAARARVAPALALLLSAAVAGLFGALGVAGALLVVVGAASLANIAGDGGAETGAGSPRAPRLARAAVVAAWAVGALAAGFGIADLNGAAAVREAEDWLQVARTGTREASGQALAPALEAATRGARSSPWDDVTHRVLAEALLGTATLAAEPGPILDRAAAAARRAVDLVPARAINHEQFARVLATRVLTGDVSAAAAVHAAVERMAALAPANALLLVEGARLELLIGHAMDARALAGRVTALYPGDAQADGVIGEASFSLGDTTEARAALRRALAGNWRGDTAAYDAARSLQTRLR